MEVGLDDTFDRQPMLSGVGQVLRDVALRIDHDSTTGTFVADKVRRVRQSTRGSTA